MNDNWINKVIEDFKETVVFETEHEEGMRCHYQDAVNWLRAILERGQILHQRALQEDRKEVLHKLHLCAIGKYDGDALENVKAQIKEFQATLPQTDVTK